MRKLMTSAGAVALLAAFGQAPAMADSVTLYCAADEAWCQLMAKDFEAETGITVDMTRKSSGEIYAQVKAEAENPKGDVWWAGTGDPHLQAAQEELTIQYESPLMGELHDWAINQAEAGDHRTVGVYSGALGFGYNKDLLAENGLPEPKCWADLIKPEFKGHIQIANPNSSGTAYTMLATIVQLMGEDEGFEYMKALHKNVNQYTKSGSAPIKAAGLGETTVGIVFLHDAVAQVAAGFPIVPVAPCEGTGYEIGSMSIIEGARNEERGEAVLRLGARRRGAVAGADGELVPAPVEQERDPVAERPRPLDDQADRLRLRQVRLERGAQAPALEVGRGGGVAAAVG